MAERKNSANLNGCLELKQTIYWNFDWRKSFAWCKIFPAKRLSIFFVQYQTLFKRASTNFPPKDLVFFYWLFHLNFLVFLRKLSCNKTFLFDIEMALLKAIVRNFLLLFITKCEWPFLSDYFSWTMDQLYFVQRNASSLASSPFKPERKRSDQWQWFRVSSQLRESHP